MKKNSIKNTIGGFFIFCSIILLFQWNIESFINCSIFVALGILLFPIFDTICRISNKSFSVGRKWALGLGTFFIPIVGVSSVKTLTFADLYTAIIIIIIYWIILFVTNKNKHVDFNYNKMLKESDKKDFISKFYNKQIQKHNKKISAI